MNSIINNKKEANDFINTYNPNGTEERFLNHISERIEQYPIKIAYCSDEKTGRRFGSANCRKDKSPKKIGGGGRNRGSIAAWQLWVWNI